MTDIIVTAILCALISTFTFLAGYHYRGTVEEIKREENDRQ